MDNFDFIFNGDKLFDFSNLEKKAMENLKRQEEESMNLNTAIGKLKQSQNESNEIDMLKHNLHVKNQIILKLLSQCEAYSGLVAEIIKSASTIPDEDTKNKIGGISKSFNDMNKLNAMLKMAIEFEEMMESNENHTI